MFLQSVLPAPFLMPHVPTKGLGCMSGNEIPQGYPPGSGPAHAKPLSYCQLPQNRDLGIIS